MLWITGFNHLTVPMDSTISIHHWVEHVMGPTILFTIGFKILYVNGRNTVVDFVVFIVVYKNFRLASLDSLFITSYSVGESSDAALDRFNTYIVLSHKGHVMWLAPKVITGSCKFEVASFPFDEQVTCIM